MRLDTAPGESVGHPALERRWIDYMKLFRNLLLGGWGVFVLIVISLFSFPKTMSRHLRFGLLELYMAGPLLTTVIYKAVQIYKKGMTRP